MEVIHTIGRRKKSVARVYMKKGSNEHKINGKTLEKYFPTTSLQAKIKKPLELTENITIDDEHEYLDFLFEHHY